MSTSKSSNAKNNGTDKEENQSFWKTLPGILTAISGVIVAVTGLVTALNEAGIFDNSAGPTPTSFPTATSVDQDVILPTLVQLTGTPTGEDNTAPPTCQNYVDYEGKANPNAIVLAYNETDFWVSYGGLHPEAEAFQDELSAYIFDTSANSGNCLRRWVRYLANWYTPHWPQATDGKGRTYNEVWLNAAIPPVVGELATWTVVPDTILITVVDENSDPIFTQVYVCGQQIPREVLSQVAYWHAATSEEAFTGYLQQYEANGYAVRNTVPCSP